MPTSPTPLRAALLVAALTLPGLSQATDAQRQAEVAQRGASVMPFALPATTHIFSSTPEGGVQRVVVKDPANAPQTLLVRQHLLQIQAQFRQGDFSGPSRIHGADMPGLVALTQAKPGEISITYREVDGGAELDYRTTHPALVTALHQWFDAQLSDHGHDAMAGHMHDMHSMHHPGDRPPP